MFIICTNSFTIKANIILLKHKTNYFPKCIMCRAPQTINGKKKLPLSYYGVIYMSRHSTLTYFNVYFLCEIFTVPQTSLRQSNKLRKL